MNIFGIYIFNSTKQLWLQDDEKSWGPFWGAVEFTPENDQYAETIRERETKNGDVTFTMAGIH